MHRLSLLKVWNRFAALAPLVGIIGLSLLGSGEGKEKEHLLIFAVLLGLLLPLAELFNRTLLPGPRRWFFTAAFFFNFVYLYAAVFGMVFVGWLLGIKEFFSASSFGEIPGLSLLLLVWAGGFLLPIWIFLSLSLGFLFRYSYGRRDYLPE